jgi:hypothetical protein
MSISVQDGFAPLIAALSTIESIGNPRTFDIKFVYGLPLLNPALIARAGGNMKSVRVILDVIASINPADVATAQDYINTHKENSPGGSGGGSISGGAKPAPTTIFLPLCDFTVRVLRVLRQ